MPIPIDFSLYLITDRRQVATGQTLLSAIEAALEGGVRAVQLREKDLSIDALRPLAKDLRALTEQYGAKLLLNTHIDLALEIGADGVHLGSQAPPITTARERLGPDRLIGVSTHSLAELHAAAEQGADFVTFGPVYATPSKAAFGPPQGLESLAEVCRRTPLPVLALGGITADNRADVLRHGASGCALIRAIMAADDPCQAARIFSA